MTTPPNSLPDDARALKELLIAARDENERLIAIIKLLQRHRFGLRSEKIDPDQLALMLEDVEQAIAAAEAEAEGKREPAGRPSGASARSIAARCPNICLARRSSSISPTSAAPAATGFGSSSARTSRNGST